MKCHWNGSAWSDEQLVPYVSMFKGIWVFADEDIWAVGMNGAIYHRSR